MATASVRPIIEARSTFQGYAVTYYQGAARDAGFDPIPTPPIREYETKDWETALNRLAEPESATVVDPDFIEKAAVRSDVHARNAERNQTVAFAVNDDNVRGWARIDRTPPTCPLCRLTISRGPVYSSKEAAGGDGNTFHGGCTCEQVLVFKGQESSWPGRELYLAEKRRYEDSTKGLSGKAAMRAYRASVAEANGGKRTAGTTRRAAEKIVKDDPRTPLLTQIAALEKTFATLQRRKDAGEDVSKPYEYQRSQLNSLRSRLAKL